MKKAAPLILTSNRPSSETCAPRADFTVLSQYLACAPLLYPPQKGRGPTSRLEHRTASDLRQAVAAVRKKSQVSVYVSLSEKIGLPLCLLLTAKRIHVPHVLVAHHLTSSRKRALQSRIRWLHRFNRIVVLAEPQAAYLRDEAGYPEERTALLPDSVDTDFWRSQGQRFAGELFVLSVGQERRDYATLFAAARELPAFRFVVVAGSVWGTRNKFREIPPPNVTVQHDLASADLRDLYDRASLVVVPLELGVLYAAGANGLLEAMSMAKPVVVTESPGLGGYVRQGENGRLVSSADPHVLANAIRHIGEDAAYGLALGLEARRAAETTHSLPPYAAALSRLVRDAESER